MRQTNLNGIDLNLLPPLEAALRTRSVSEAAVEVGLSQPAMSRALARLRHLLDDPLLVRVGRYMVRTPRGDALYPLVVQALEGMRPVFAPQSFNPAAAERRVVIAGSDLHAILLLPALARRVAREAPGITLVLEGYGRDPARRMLEGAVDVIFATSATPLPPGAMSAVIGADRLVLVTRRGHALANGLVTMEAYASAGHVTVSILGDGASEVDARLAACGLSRLVAATTPHFMAALSIVAKTDLVTTISEAFAARFAEPLSLTVRPAPFGEAAFELSLVWAAFKDVDPVLSWLRTVIRDVAREGFGELAQGSGV
ncbi:LysR family transcriptional regulator [bacterium]|nr:LysR family transcriptional regulator [bacterium]